MKAMSVLFAAALIGAPDASAQVLNLIETNRANSAANCQGARPVDREALRVRPLAGFNEYAGDSVFVTCSYASNDALLGIDGFGIRFTNLSTESRTVTCTGVVGEEGTPRYYTKAITLGPLATGQVAFSGNDNNDLMFGDRLSLSCLVPPQVGLNDNWVSSVLPLF